MTNQRQPGRIWKSEINGISQYVVSSRNLHESLNIAEKYSVWIESQIKNLDLKGSSDFEVNVQKIKTNDDEQKDIVLTDCFLSISAANNIAVLANSKEGREIRNYFSKREESELIKKQKEKDLLEKRENETSNTLTFFEIASKKELEKLKLKDGDFKENLENHPFKNSKQNHERRIYKNMVKKA